METEFVLIPLWGGRGKESRVIEYAKVSPEDVVLVAQHHWSFHRGYGVSHGPKRPNGTYPQIRMHRLILGCEGHIDHMNRVRSDNRRQNLREATSAQNSQNTPLRNPTGFRGVKQTGPNRWVAVAKINKRKVSLIPRDSIIEAAKDYDCAVFHEYGPQSAFNFPGEVNPARIDLSSLGLISGKRRLQKSKTGYRGVDPTSYGRYMARITDPERKGGNKYLGTFDTAEAAALAYNKAALELLGPDAILNVV